jgi:hypothetical protein
LLNNFTNPLGKNSVLERILIQRAARPIIATARVKDQLDFILAFNFDTGLS